MSKKDIVCCLKPLRLGVSDKDYKITNTCIARFQDWFHVLGIYGGPKPGEDPFPAGVYCTEFIVNILSISKGLVTGKKKR